MLLLEKMITTTQKGDQDIPKLLLNEIKGDLDTKKGDQNTFQHALTKSSKISNAPPTLKHLDNWNKWLQLEGLNNVI